MKIIVGYDGSDAAKEAVRVAQKHAQAFDGKIYLVTSLAGGTAENEKELEKAKNELGMASKFLENRRIACEEHLLVRGMEPGEDIVRFAEDHQADEIIIGVHKKSRVQKFLLGSNAQHVILNAPCLVSVVK